MTTMKMPRKGGQTAKRRALYAQTALDVNYDANKITSAQTIHYHLLWSPDASDEADLYGPTVRVAFSWSASSGEVTEAAYMGAALLLDRSPAGGSSPPNAPTNIESQDNRWLSRHFLPYSGRQLVPLSTEFKLRFVKLKKQETLYVALQHLGGVGNPTLFYAVQATTGFRTSASMLATNLR